MNSESAARFNARLTVISSFITDLAFILPIWLLYSLDILKLTPTVAVAIFMAIWVTSALLEIPTGALADRLGRKKVFIIGQFLFSLYPLAYAFEFPVPLLVAFALISALGSAMRSGALIPIVHRSHDTAGISQEKYENFLSNYHTAGFVARALTGVAGAALYTVNPKWPFFALFLVTVANFVLGFLIKSPKHEEKATLTNMQHIQQTIAAMKQSDAIVAAIVSFCLFNLVAEAIWTGYQVYFQKDGFSALTIGILFSIIALLSATGAYIIRFINRRLKPLKIMQIYGAGVLLTAIILTQPIIHLRPMAIVPMGIVSGMTIFTINATVQKQIKNIYHSTALSVVNFVQYATYAVGSLLFGVLIQSFGNATSRHVLLALSLVMSAGIAVYVYRNRKLEEFMLNNK